MRNIFLVLTILLVLSSCASKLRVEVQIADRDRIIEEDKKYPKEYNYASSIAALEKFIRDWPTDVNLNSIFTFVEEKMEANLDTGVKDAYKKALISKIDEIEKLKEAASANYVKNDLHQTHSNLNEANLRIEQLRLLLIAYNILVPEIIDNNFYVKKLSNDINRTKTVVENGTERTRFPILGDELASFIAKNENDYIWKSVFNKTVSSNFLGNTDIAMILRSNPPEREIRSGDYNNNFTIKGVRNDAADASNALITGLTQTINFIANTQGIPTNISTPSTESPTPVDNPLVSAIEADKNKLALKKAKLLSLKRMLIEKILLENVGSRTTDSDAQASAKRIIDYWTALKVELNKP